MKKLLLIVVFTVAGCTEEQISDRDYPRFYPLTVEGITRNTATFSVEIFYSSVPILDHGFVYSTPGFPSITKGTKVSLGPGDGPGAFSHKASDLLPNSMYYVRAYATSAGHVVYSSTGTFKTPN